MSSYWILEQSLPIGGAQVNVDVTRRSAEIRVWVGNGSVGTTFGVTQDQAREMAEMLVKAADAADAQREAAA